MITGGTINARNGDADDRQDGIRNGIKQICRESQPTAPVLSKAALLRRVFGAHIGD
ncbi:MAG: hypothetical protein HPM95_15500 [Alphaproteobacteria bacterium]|nr:hypothetical protein [Alphaproteobacteria bacterium]